MAKGDPEPKALACYGLLVRHGSQPAEQMHLRFVAGRPVSAVTALSTCCLSTCPTSMTVHDCLGRYAYAAVETLVMSCQVWNRFPIS